MKPPLHFIGMWGIGDNLHQRAVIVELMKSYEVWLETCHVWLHRDLIEAGNLHLILRPTPLHMHAQNITREKALWPNIYRAISERPKPLKTIRNWYHKPEIDRYGSILETMWAVAGLKPRRIDFSLPIGPEWRTSRVMEIVTRARASGKPVMIYRPIVLRKEWDGHLRNPDPLAYNELYRAARENFYVISIASLKPGVEWIVGGEQPADLKIHDGSLEMWEMAALVAQSDLVFCNAGMAPVLAQATGIASIVVYGGRESFRTTQRAGAHLAPTLGIDPINPCDCHSHTHACDKRIDVEKAMARIRTFVDENLAVRHDLRRHPGEARHSEPVV
jgi:hypothetical protein